MRMIPTPGSRVQSSETPGARTQTTTPTHTTTEDDEPPPPEPDLMPWPPVDNPLPEGEEEDVALEEELARQAGRVYLRWDGGNCWNKVRKGTTKIRWVFENYYRWFVPQFSMAPDHAVRFWWDRWRRGYEHRIDESWRMRASKRLREIMHGIRNKGVNKRNRASSTGGSLHTEGSTTYEATRERMALELGRTPTQSEVFARTHTRKEDRGWVDKRLSDVNKRLQDERQAAIDAGGPVPPPPPIDEAEVWARVGGSRKRGRVYGMGVVPSHKYPPLFSDPDDDDTASGPPDLREQVTLLNREISQQAEVHAQSLAAVEAVCAEK
ncbi:hypothetical protein PIB30_069631, partial [Stylosanthes scabra]|nr:hypothetical protein [Stylosanthes scabra]